MDSSWFQLLFMILVVAVVLFGIQLTVCCDRILKEFKEFKSDCRIFHQETLRAITRIE